jgi:hypothetical protein
MGAETAWVNSLSFTEADASGRGNIAKISTITIRDQRRTAHVDAGLHRERGVTAGPKHREAGDLDILIVIVLVLEIDSVTTRIHY